MKRFIFTGIIVFFCFYSGKTQVTEVEKDLRKINTDTIISWKKGITTTINFSQASFTNWAAGGQNSIAVNGLLSAFANHKRPKSSWDNMLDIGYGVLKQSDKDKLIKTDDKIDFTSKYGKKASKEWSYATLINFKTQFANGYKYPNDSVIVSDFFAPAYILGAIGMDYKPNDKLTAFVAPITSKTTLVYNQDLANAGAFGVKAAERDTAGNILVAGKNRRSEIGGYVRIVYKTNIFKDNSVNLLTKLDLFSNYIENPQNIDVSWETIITFKVNKFISASLTTHLIYDDDVKIGIDTTGDGKLDSKGPRTQFKEVIAIGFSYKF